MWTPNHSRLELRRALRCVPLAERFEWSCEASGVVQSEACPRSSRAQWLSGGFLNIRQALHSDVSDIDVDLNGQSWTIGGSSSACYCRTFRLPSLNCSLTTWSVNAWHFCVANRSSNLREWQACCESCSIRQFVDSMGMSLSGANGDLLRRCGWRLRTSSPISRMAKSCWSCWRSSRERKLGNRTTERRGFTMWRTWTRAWRSCKPRQDVCSFLVFFEGLTAALLRVQVFGYVTLCEGSTARTCKTSVYRHPATRRHIPDDLSVTEKSCLWVG